MDVAGVLDRLNAALELQLRSALELAVAAGSLRGVPWQPVVPVLWSFALEELADARRLVEKIVALGGQATSVPAPFTCELEPEAWLDAILDHEAETVAALHAVIPLTGQEPRSEALEHRLEHQIMRKQEQLDTLRRMLGRADDG